jgi:hypothetical protein
VTLSLLAASLGRIGQVQAQLSPAASLALALVSAVAALVPGLWLVTRHITVMAHEGAHATVGSFMGRRVNGIRFKLNADGATSLAGGGALGTFVATLFGYLGPSAFGLAAAAMITTGHIIAVLWLGLAALLAIMVLIRKSFGVVTVILAFLLLFGVAGFGSVGAQVVTAYAVAWFLLVSGVRIITIRGAHADDAGRLRSMTKIPASFWSLVWLIGSLVALVFGATLLV